MSKEELEKLKKRTIKICTFTALMGFLACIVPVIILKGMVDYLAKTKSAVSGPYLAVGIIAAAIIGLIVFVCVRTFTGTLRTFKEKKKG